ncbi:hypothetical protein [Arthrobacter rhizosphaerae]|nr:hypothetical protein [Arthrobacter rhizosphaerae]
MPGRRPDIAKALGVPVTEALQATDLIYIVEGIQSPVRPTASSLRCEPNA